MNAYDRDSGRVSTIESNRVGPEGDCVAVSLVSIAPAQVPVPRSLGHRSKCSPLRPQTSLPVSWALLVLR